MNLRFTVVAACVAIASCATSYRASGPKGEKPLDALPYSPSLDLGSLDPTVDPCTDFYQYVCGGWMANNPIPPDQSSWSVYGKLYNDNQRFLWGILADLAEKGSGRNAAQQKIGDYFAACMDESKVEKLGISPLKPTFAAIDAIKTKKQIAPFVAHAHLQSGDSAILFGFGSNQDFENSEAVIAFAVAGGLGLPDRDYYTRTDAKSVEIREKYAQHIRNMFALLGDKPEQTQVAAETVLSIETALAKASLTNVEKRDPHKLLHKYRRKGLQQLTPSFDWKAYFDAIGEKGLDRFNVTEPKFFREVEHQLKTRKLAELRTYLRWHALSSAAPLLASDFVEEDFNFYGRALRGTKELKPRWKRCVEYVDGQLGEALGQEFVARAFSPDLKRKTVEMTNYIEVAMQQEIEALDWMSDATKKRAIEKLHAVVNKVGYPDRWRDYGPVTVKRDDFLGNAQRAAQFEMHRQLAKIGKPIDRTEWGMTPPTVNAYYNPQMNDINFPAGVLEPPLYDAKMDDAPNYGNTGSTIGHELTHGFDDEGRQFDAKGNLKDWWTERDAKAFDERAQCIVEQYGNYTAIDELKINSKLTLGEDIADLGGTVLAYIAWQAATKNQDLRLADGFRPDQRFFIGLGQWACENVRPERARELALTNPHSPGRYRINGVVSNMPEFRSAFACKASAAMVNPKRCKIW